MNYFPYPFYLDSSILVSFVVRASLLVDGYDLVPRRSSPGLGAESSVTAAEVNVDKLDKSGNAIESETTPECKQFHPTISWAHPTSTTLAEKVLRFIDPYLPETAEKNISGQEEK
jgi:hypothetical protein